MVLFLFFEVKYLSARVSQRVAFSPQFFSYKLNLFSLLPLKLIELCLFVLFVLLEIVLPGTLEETYLLLIGISYRFLLFLMVSSQLPQLYVV